MDKVELSLQSIDYSVNYVLWYLLKSERARSAQYRARKQAVDLLNGRLLTRAVLRRSQAFKYSKT